jgi:response regulator RpfG family c-di-GMP phosphodiesterase
MQKILVVDDDEDVRGLHRLRLSDTYEIIETEDAEEALALALQHKPAAILLDLMMPKFSGFEVCQSLHSLSYTSLIPIFVITGESAAKYKEHCESLGARAFFEKPVNYQELKRILAAELKSKQKERRAHVRVRMNLILKLRGTDPEGNRFEITAATENVSAGGFLCSYAGSLVKDSIVDVYLSGTNERFAGRARVVRREAPDAPWQRYALQFVEVSPEWVLQARR